MAWPLLIEASWNALFAGSYADATELLQRAIAEAELAHVPPQERGVLETRLANWNFSRKLAITDAFRASLRALRLLGLPAPATITHPMLLWELALLSSGASKHTSGASVLRQIPNGKWRRAAVDAWAALGFALLTGAGLDNSFPSEILKQGWSDPGLAAKYVLFKCTNMASVLRHDPEASGYTLAQSLAGLTYGLGLKGVATGAIARATESAAMRSSPAHTDTSCPDPTAAFGVLDSKGFLSVANAVRAITDGRMADAHKHLRESRHHFLSGSNVIQAVMVTRAAMTMCCLSDPNLATARRIFLDLAALVEDLTGHEGVLGRIILRKARAAIGSLHTIPGWVDEVDLAGLLDASSANCFENFRGDNKAVAVTTTDASTSKQVEIDADNVRRAGKIGLWWQLITKSASIWERTAWSCADAAAPGGAAGGGGGGGAGGAGGGHGRSGGASSSSSSCWTWTDKCEAARRFGFLAGLVPVVAFIPMVYPQNFIHVMMAFLVLWRSQAPPPQPSDRDYSDKEEEMEEREETERIKDLLRPLIPKLLEIVQTLARKQINMTLKCRLWELLLVECVDPSLRRRGHAVCGALRKALAATPIEWRVGFLRCHTLDAEYHLARVTQGAEAAAAALAGVRAEMVWTSPERMVEQVAADHLFAYQRCTVFMFAGEEEGFESSADPRPKCPNAAGGRSCFGC